jgi:hypothetical protein
LFIKFTCLAVFFILPSFILSFFGGSLATSLGSGRVAMLFFVLQNGVVNISAWLCEARRAKFSKSGWKRGLERMNGLKEM